MKKKTLKKLSCFYRWKKHKNYEKVISFHGWKKRVCLFSQMKTNILDKRKKVLPIFTDEEKKHEK